MESGTRNAAVAGGTSASLVVLIATAAGLATGLVEAGVRGFQLVALDRMLALSPQFPWLVPAVYVGLFNVIALPLVVLTLVARSRPSARTVVAFFAGLGCVSLLLVWYPKLHALAIVVLGAGVAVQVRRQVTGDAVRLRAVARRSVAVMAAVVVVLAGLANVPGTLTERGALASLPAASRGPNVLLIILDTVRAASLRMHGYARNTMPRLEALASSGVRYERAFSTSSWTLPSHASIFTGHSPFMTGTDWGAPLSDTLPTLAETLQARGYATGGFVGNLTYAGRQTGLDRGFIRYDDYRFSVVHALAGTSLGRFIPDSPRIRRVLGLEQSPGRRSAGELAAAALEWIRSVEGRPFFAFLNLYDPHAPYLPPEPWDTLFGPARPHDGFAARLWNGGRPLAKRPVQTRSADQRREDYDEVLAYVDAQIGALLDALAHDGRLDNTLVVVTADHGEVFGEHGLDEHAASLYLPALHVPLVIVPPGGAARGEIVQQPVSLQDLPATILDVADVADTRIPGASLAASGWRGAADRLIVAELQGGINRPAHEPYSRGDMVSIITGALHYIMNGDGVEELYWYDLDPGERSNVAGDSTLLVQLHVLRARAQAALAIAASRPRSGRGGH